MFLQNIERIFSRSSYDADVSGRLKDHNVQQEDPQPHEESDKDEIILTLNNSNSVEVSLIKVTVNITGLHFGKNSSKLYTKRWKRAIVDLGPIFDSD